MPKRAASACNRPGCSGLVRNGVCSVCGPRRYKDHRVSAARRGYGRRWQRLRRIQLGREPFCVHCAEFGRVTAATDVDHIVARRDGGEDALFNLQSLCHSCHSRKTAGGG